MMKRREALQLMGAGAVIAATPSLVDAKTYDDRFTFHRPIYVTSDKGYISFMVDDKVESIKMELEDPDNEQAWVRRGKEEFCAWEEVNAKKYKSIDIVELRHQHKTNWLAVSSIEKRDPVDPKSFKWRDGWDTLNIKNDLPTHGTNGGQWAWRGRIEITATQITDADTEIVHVWECLYNESKQEEAAEAYKVIDESIGLAQAQGTISRFHRRLFGDPIVHYKPDYGQTARLDKGVLVYKYSEELSFKLCSICYQEPKHDS